MKLNNHKITNSKELTASLENMGSARQHLTKMILDKGYKIEC